MEKPPASLVTVRTLSRLFGVPPKWLKNEALAGRIPSLKADGRWLFNVSAVERVLLDRAARVAVTSEGARNE